MKREEFLPFTRPTIDEDTIADVAAVLRSGWLTSGPRVKAFEEALSTYCAGRPVRAFSSGTATLETALRLAGIGPGDEVITSPLTWVATANVILAVGASPVFVDIDPRTRNIDPERIAAAITPKTRALIPVDLAGLPVDRTQLAALVRQHSLRIIEDAAQSFGATWNGQPIGQSFFEDRDFVSFSFHANKNLTTGEGGALVLPADIDPALCERLRLQGVHRFPDGGMDVDVPGGKANLTDIAATIGLGQLKRLAEFTARRRLLARHYFTCLDREWCCKRGCELPPEDHDQSNWHMFQILLPRGTDRGSFIAAMKEHNIGIGVHYPALHLFSLYRQQGFKPGDFPHAEDVGTRTVTLPLFPAMSLADVEYVCHALKAVLANTR
ncbi:MAG: DegT/DnrJ/EryC1/StrS aminotransferase family protein [Sterolibacterium sp.]|jgi:dTDP-4-amino-4,6-dideoxygalactose transaminase|nr:DegT/DnrJ/EryC1/StrS aminotransferase family protein [Sterolibacterium sp.]MBP9799410.1 DegT/DnrJ/EryC1/StrS aminotransferase family protein [Sterolibacterium sp.]